MTKIPHVGDFITLKRTNNIYVPKGARLVVVGTGNSISGQDTIVHVTLNEKPYLVHVDNIKTISAKERIEFT